MAYHFTGIPPEDVLSLALNNPALTDVKICLNQHSVKVNSCILSLALPWLRDTLTSEENSENNEIFLETSQEISSPDAVLNSLITLMHFGFLKTKFSKEVVLLCEILGMNNVHVEKELTTLIDQDVDREVALETALELSTDVTCDNTVVGHDMNSDDDEEPAISVKTSDSPKKKCKRIFTANLSVEDLTCNVCQKTFNAPYKLKIHSLIHSEKFPFFCSFCNKGFNNKYKKKGHEKRHHGSGGIPSMTSVSSWSENQTKLEYSCEKCRAAFDTKKARREHIQAAHPLMYISSHSCPLCQKVFKGLKGLNNHISNASCQKNRRNQMNAEGCKSFKCDKCNCVCSSRKSLNCHYRQVHLEGSELPFKCATCSRSFLKQSYLEEHQNRFHSLIKPFACMFCPKRCATKQDLDRHLMSHRGEAIFQCQYCEKSFVHRASLKKHQRGHLGERPYRCNPCDKNFGLLSVLQKHQKSHIRKGDKTIVRAAPKGHRGCLSFIEYVDKELSIPMPIEYAEPHKTMYEDPYSTTVYQEQNYSYQVVEPNQQPDCQQSSDLTETESIAMDILGLLRDQQGQQRENPVDKL